MPYQSFNTHLNHLHICSTCRLRTGPSSLKHLAVTAASVSFLELAFSMPFSLLGFLLLTSLLGTGTAHPRSACSAPSLFGHVLITRALRWGSTSHAEAGRLIG